MNSYRIDTVALLLRAALGSVLIAHGLLKFLVFTLPGTAGFFASVGMPAWAAYVVAPFEVMGGLAILIGFRSNWVALASLPVLIGAFSVHFSNGWLFTNKNGGWEFPAVLILMAIGVALLGDGMFSLRRSKVTAQ